jgi:hypothetical protein
MDLLSATGVILARGLAVVPAARYSLNFSLPSKT